LEGRGANEKVQDKLRNKKLKGRQRVSCNGGEKIRSGGGTFWGAEVGGGKVKHHLGAINQHKKYETT